MGTLFITPLVVSGQISGSDWLNVATVVDMELIASNFRKVLASLHGGIHASNLDISSFFAQKLSDAAIQFPEYITTGNYYPGTGLQHSHNGVDSAFLGPSAIDLDCTARLDYGMYMLPSKTRNMTVYHGRAEITSLVAGTLATPALNTFKIAVPSDGSEVTFSGCRLFLQQVVVDPSLYYKIGNPFGYVTTDGGIPFIVVQLYVTDVPVSISGLYLDWAITLVAA